MHKRRVLFILKKRSPYGFSAGYDTASSGLYHSARFCFETLLRAGVTTRIVVVNDNNNIDREVAAFKATDVIIEALWVVPEKFEVLRRLHPGVRWIVRVHSELPFVANEGVAMEWIQRYLRMAYIYVSGNSVRLDEELRTIAGKGWEHKVLYLPNCYNDFNSLPRYGNDGGPVNIGCFGAIRPLKNQLIQAVAAIKFADTVARSLRFHINAGRIEQQGNSVLKNLRALFAGMPPRYQLIEHPWMPRPDYLRLVRRMDLGMQVSLSETFNITTADMVSRDVPVVVSPEVSWVSSFYQADPTDSNSIARRLRFAWAFSGIGLHRVNTYRLRRFAEHSAHLWVKQFGG